MYVTTSKKSRMMILGIAFVFALVALVSGCGSSQKPAEAPKAPEGPKYKLKLATQLPDSHPIAQVTKLYAQKVKERSKGEIELQVFTNSTLGQERDLLEGMKLGTVDIANANAAMMTGFAPRWQVFSLPYIFQSEEHMYKVVNGPIGQELNKDLEKNGLKVMVFHWSGFRSITTKQKPITKPEDLNGLKIRSMTSKIMVDSINAMGAIATPMDQGAVYNALQSGVLDGWENNPATVVAYKMNEVCPYFSNTNHFATPNLMLISLKTWEKLPENVRKLLMDVAMETQKDESDIFHKDDAANVEKLKAAGMKFNDVDTKPFVERARPVWKSVEDVVGKNIFDEIDKLRTN